MATEYIHAIRIILPLYQWLAVAFSYGPSNP